MDTSDINARRDDEEPQAPPKLVAALEEPSARRVFVPPAVDDAVLNIARRHLARPQRNAFGPIRSWLMWPAVATACVVLIGLVYFMAKPRANSRLAREDVNHDGRMDILDAFQLARELQSGKQAPNNLDLNGDGVVDQRDATILAAHAVQLAKGGPP